MSPDVIVVTILVALDEEHYRLELLIERLALELLPELWIESELCLGAHRRLRIVCPCGVEVALSVGHRIICKEIDEVLVHAVAHWLRRGVGAVLHEAVVGSERRLFFEPQRHGLFLWE